MQQGSPFILVQQLNLLLALSNQARNVLSNFIDKVTATVCTTNGRVN